VETATKGLLLFVGASYPFLDLLWTIIIIFTLMIWFWPADLDRIGRVPPP
jgi:hypothetical protein